VNIVGDWEHGIWLIYDGNQIRKYSREQFLNGEVFRDYPNAVFIVEAPHMKDRASLSVAQIYTVEELSIVAKHAIFYGVTIKLFPAKQTVRAAQEAGNGERDSHDKWHSDKSLDTKSIYDFIVNHSEIPLMAWKPGVDKSEVHSRRDAMRANMSRRLNQMRPNYDSAEVELARKVLFSNFHTVSDDVRKWFPIDIINMDRTNERLTYKDNRLMAVWVAVFNEDGSLRRTDQGDFIGVREVWGTLWLHAFHGKGGTARSNLIHWALKSAEAGERDKDIRASFNQAVKELIKVFRDYGLANDL
jgi:hypothetical protein